jgi:hypothetical protein
MEREEVIITGSDFWFKNVDFLQTNWALITPIGASDQVGAGARVWFMSELGGVFDELEFPDEQAAKQALTKNGFSRFTEDDEAKELLAAPERPFSRREHPNGRIYSSGKFWRV